MIRVDAGMHPDRGGAVGGERVVPLRPVLERIDFLDVLEKQAASVLRRLLQPIDVKENFKGQVFTFDIGDNYWFQNACFISRPGFFKL